MRNLTIILNREEAQNLFTLLTWARPVIDEEIKLQLELQEILVKYLKPIADDVELVKKHKQLDEQKTSECKHCGRRDSSTMCKLFPSPCKNK